MGSSLLKRVHPLIIDGLTENSTGWSRMDDSFSGRDGRSLTDHLDGTRWRVAHGSLRLVFMLPCVPIERLSLMYLSFILIISSRESSSSIPSNSFIGIPPQDEDYFKREIIKCKNGSKKFTKAQLNDDFCDCPDGTDEPDCCDGSDEYDGKVKCPYTCHEAGKVAMESLKRKIEVYQEGVILRKVEIGLAKRAIARDKAELSRLKNEREVVEKVVHQLEGQVRKLE
ncbi:hypothetical protein PVK06_048011 [Gossypium arboreum]|uniref:Glucosidase 2 subunit beta n=1 Tax=Gossypium arboreum TaxID=29729 RepID=A0ABR0MHF2_GOSAR|nr:hypothetical protein PVK06_048011 [Gossypium arboreum]